MDHDRESGILDTVPIQFIVRAMYSLPPPDGALPSERSVELFVPQSAWSGLPSGWRGGVAP